MRADLIFHSKQHICPSENNGKTISPLVTKVRRDVSPKKSLVSLQLNPKISGDFRPAEQIFPETNRWVPLIRSHYSCRRITDFSKIVATVSLHMLEIHEILLSRFHYPSTL